MYQLLTPTGLAPTKAYDDDAGFDLYCDAEVVIEPSTFVDIPLGVAIKVPEGTWGLLTARSSTLRKHGLMVAQGIIDCGYTGPLFAGVWNMTDQPIRIEAGTRLVQYILMHNASLQVEAQEVVELPKTNRGAAGFGSSGA
ncbi:Dut dUTPase [uncultured Caudovirales phage]|uniref:dUTP diphosphatase n=1 Tax=uncultured Caudovirales phage TaxID=2100421 RepID=A0A6J5SI30_9CAUD|nr:Dut dUTPase [uncultured Caudovirales phage]CAB4202581.1 Dut dUTPase [uncultured Caudovirales phage]CAB4213944.1 Dut dUTPase [uncultured Caudovirales phage]CAB5228609.1 Dut dUTPase [uncultured Caudovirales phage]